MNLFVLSGHGSESFAAFLNEVILQQQKNAARLLNRKVKGTTTALRPRKCALLYLVGVSCFHYGHCWTNWRESFLNRLSDI